MTATSVRTTYRQALQTLLANAFGIRFVGGEIRPPAQNEDIGCVWWERKRPFAVDGNNQEDLFRVRVLKLFAQNQGEEFVNQEALEALADSLEDALKSFLGPGATGTPPAVLRAAGFDYFTVTEVMLDSAGQFVEAQLVTQSRNRSAQGG